MPFDGMNYLAVAVAAAAGFVFGALWYTLLGKQWMAALGKTKEQLSPSPLPFVIAAIGQLVIAFVLAGAIGHLGVGQVTVKNALISAAILWVGFVLTTMAVNHAFQGAKTMLTAIDSGHWLGVMLVQALVLGLFGV